MSLGPRRAAALSALLPSPSFFSSGSLREPSLWGGWLAAEAGPSTAGTAAAGYHIPRLTCVLRLLTQVLTLSSASAFPLSPCLTLNSTAPDQKRVFQSAVLILYSSSKGRSGAVRTGEPSTSTICNFTLQAHFQPSGTASSAGYHGIPITTASGGGQRNHNFCSTWATQ